MKIRIKETNELETLALDIFYYSDSELESTMLNIFIQAVDAKTSKTNENGEFELSREEYIWWRRLALRYSIVENERRSKIESAKGDIIELNHLYIDSRDLETSLDFAERYLGIKERESFSPYGWDKVTPHLDFAKMDFIN